MEVGKQRWAFRVRVSGWLDVGNDGLYGEKEQELLSGGKPECILTFDDWRDKPTQSRGHASSFNRAPW